MAHGHTVAIPGTEPLFPSAATWPMSLAFVPITGRASLSALMARWISQQSDKQGEERVAL